MLSPLSKRELGIFTCRSFSFLFILLVFFVVGLPVLSRLFVESNSNAHTAKFYFFLNYEHENIPDNRMLHSSLCIYISYVIADHF